MTIFNPKICVNYLRQLLEYCASSANDPLNLIAHSVYPIFSLHFHRFFFFWNSILIYSWFHLPLCAARRNVNSASVVSRTNTCSSEYRFSDAFFYSSSPKWDTTSNKQRTSIICFEINCQQFIIFASFHLTDNFMSHRLSCRFAPIFLSWLFLSMVLVLHFPPFADTIIACVYRCGRAWMGK